MAFLLLGLAADTRAQWDDFDDGNDLGWTHYDPLSAAYGGSYAQYDFPGGGYRIQARNPPSLVFGGARAASVQAADSYTRFYISVDVVDWNASLDQAIGVIARAQNMGLGTTDGYALTVQTGDNDLAISRIDNETPTQLDGALASLAFTPGQDYRLVFSGNGTNFVGRVYVLPNLNTPVATVTGSDSMYAAGVNGLIVADFSGVLGGTADATFDRYVALDVDPPRLTIVVDPAREVTVSWPAEATGFDLEGAGLLAPTDWTAIPAAQIQTEGTNQVHRTNAATGIRYFRLKRTL